MLFVLSLQNLTYGAEDVNQKNSLVVNNSFDNSGVVRGELISSMEISLSDNGGGSFNIYADVLCHQNMKEIRLNLYLDKWNESAGTWSQIKSYNYIWNESNTPEEDRHSGVVDFDVFGLERGRTYRLRGVASATALDGTRSRVWRTETNSTQLQSLD